MSHKTNTMNSNHSGEENKQINKYPLHSIESRIISHLRT
jgi:hypothetical protein